MRGNLGTVLVADGTKEDRVELAGAGFSAGLNVAPGFLEVPRARVDLLVGQGGQPRLGHRGIDDRNRRVCNVHTDPVAPDKGDAQLL